MANELERPQCEEIVYVKDCYRRTGRGPGGFEIHYNRQQCSRNAQEGRKFCWQHPWATKHGVPMDKKAAGS